MPDAIITSTASTFGTITGTFAADQSTITGTVSGVVVGTLTGSVGVPGPAGPAGIGLPAGGASGQYLQKTSNADYATDWVTVNLSAFAVKANNLSDLGSISTARDNLGLGSLSTPTFSGVTVQGSGANVANLTPTSLSLTHVSSGSFTIQPSVGITFPDASVQTTAFTGIPSAYISSVSSPLSVTSGNLSVDLSAYLTSATAASTYQTLAGMSSYLTTAIAASTYQTLAGMSDYLSKAGNLAGLANTGTARTNLGLGSLAVINDAPSDGSQYARRNGAWDVVTATSSYITSVSSPLSVTSGNLTIDLSPYAPLASPVFTGDARAVTAALGDNDNSIATTAFVQQELLSGTANARNLEVYVRNQTGSTIPAGAIVYINGATGNRPTITLAQANNDANSAQTFGFVKASIANNGFGFVIVRGELENVDTSALTEGVQLYLSPTTPGTWTTTKPSAPQHLVYVGICVRAHPTQGVILVAIQNGYELGEIHDIQLGTLANNDLLAYESSTDLWKNKTYSALGLLTTAAANAAYMPVSPSTISMSGGSALITFPSGLGLDYNNITTKGIQILSSAGVTIGRFQSDAVLIPSVGITFSDASVQTTAFTGFSGYATESWVTAGFYPLTGNPSSFLVAADIAGLAPLASPALTGNVTITTNSASPALFITQTGTGNILTLHDQASDTTFVAIDQNGKVSTIPSTTAGAGFNIAHGVAPTTFVDGDVWSTTGGLFWRQNGATKQAMNLSDAQTISGGVTFSSANLTIGNSTATGNIAIANGATISGSTKNVNIGTNGTAGSSTVINIGTTVGTSITTINNTAADTTLHLANGGTASGSTKTVNIGTAGALGSTTVVNVGPAVGAVTTALNYTTAASTLNLGTGATISGSTKAVNLGTSGVAGSTTNITIGSTTGTSTTTLQGITNGVTQTAGDSSLKLATTAFVTTADNLKANLASPTFTGVPAAPTATLGTNTTQIATTAFVQSAVSAGAGAVWGSITGTLSSQTDLQSALDAKLSTATAASTYAPLASPTFTGTVTIPSGASISGYATTASLASYAPLASPTFTGTVTIPAGASISGFAPLASPTFTGTPSLPTGTTAVTQTLADNSTKLATTAYVDGSIPANNVKAWVNFNGTGTVAIRASLNVSSITDNGVGTYTVNFTTAISDTNYAVLATSNRIAATTQFVGMSEGTRATTSIQVFSNYGASGVLDTSFINVTVLR